MERDHDEASGEYETADPEGGGRTRAHRLTARFEQANAELIAFVERCPEVAWRATGHHRGHGQPFSLAWSEKMLCAHESWSVGLVAHHIAEDEFTILDLIQLVAARQPYRMVLQTIDSIRTQHADQHGRAASRFSQHVVLPLLRRGGDEVVSVLRGLNDEQLTATVPHPVWEDEMVSAAELIEQLLIGHIQLHLGAIRTVVPV